MSRYKDINGNEIAPDTVIEITKINGKTKYFLIKGEPWYNEGYLNLPGCYLTKWFAYDIRNRKNSTTVKLEKIKVVGTRDQYEWIKEENYTKHNDLEKLKLKYEQYKRGEM